jgi:hypothetical protein
MAVPLSTEQRIVSKCVRLLAAAAALSFAAAAPAAVVTLTKLDGLTGTELVGPPAVPALTAVFRADLSTAGIGTVLSITITDNSFGLGGAPGRFSGFDLDAVKLSTEFCTTAACAASAVGLNVFDFGAGTLFTPGTQRDPVDPKLFGTDATGLAVDNAVATLGLFDGVSTTGPEAAGFLSLGDGGRLTFNLTAAVATTGLYLYIGEVGDNGEAVASEIIVRDNRVPLPGTLALVGAGLLALGASRQRRQRA